MAELWIKVFLAIFCPLVVAFIIALVKGYIELRDAKRDHDKCLKSDNDVIKALQGKLTELKDTYEKDRVERNSLMTMATSIDTKIDAKLKEVLEKIAEQRRQDTAMFSQAVSDLNATLGKVNVTLEYMSKDIDGIKKNHHV